MLSNTSDLGDRFARILTLLASAYLAIRIGLGLFPA